MSEQNKAQIRRVIEEVYNRGDLDLVDEVAASDLVSMPRPRTSMAARVRSSMLPLCAQGSRTFTSPLRTRSPKATWW